MAASSVIKHFTDGSIQVKDGTGTPVTFALPFTQGDMSISGLSQKLRAVNAYESRGKLHSVRHGARSYPTCSINLMLADYSDASDNTPADFILKSGSFAANESGFGANADVYVLAELVLTIEGTDHGDGNDHTITLKNVHCTVDLSEGEPNTMAISGTVYGLLDDAGVLANSVSIT